MNSTEELIQNCKNNVLNNKQISKTDAKTLFQTKDNFLKNLSDAANEITRFYQGKKIDIEQLTNIKKIIVVKIVHFVANQHFLIQKLMIINFNQQKKLLARLKQQKIMGQILFV